MRWKCWWIYWVEFPSSSSQSIKLFVLYNLFSTLDFPFLLWYHFFPDLLLLSFFSIGQTASKQESQIEWDDVTILSIQLDLKMWWSLEPIITRSAEKLLKGWDVFQHCWKSLSKTMSNFSSVSSNNEEIVLSKIIIFSSLCSAFSAHLKSISSIIFLFLQLELYLITIAYKEYIVKISEEWESGKAPKSNERNLNSFFSYFNWQQKWSIIQWEDLEGNSTQYLLF